jgi:hypothetical protein
MKTLFLIMILGLFSCGKNNVEGVLGKDQNQVEFFTVTSQELLDHIKTDVTCDGKWNRVNVNRMNDALEVEADEEGHTWAYSFRLFFFKDNTYQMDFTISYVNISENRNAREDIVRSIKGSAEVTKEGISLFDQDGALFAKAKTPIDVNEQDYRFQVELEDHKLLRGDFKDFPKDAREYVFVKNTANIPNGFDRFCGDN